MRCRARHSSRSVFRESLSRCSWSVWHCLPRDGSRDLLPILLEPPWIGHLIIDDEIRWHAQTSSSRRRELSHSSDVPHRRLAEVPLVLAVEVRGIVVTDSVAGFRRVEIFAKHQAPGLLKPQLLSGTAS